MTKPVKKLVTKAEAPAKKKPVKKTPVKKKPAKPGAPRARTAAATAPADAATRDYAAEARAAVAALERMGSKRFADDLATRYGIRTADRTLGVPMSRIQALGKQLGESHALAAALWATGVYEARTLACSVEDPAQVSAAQMERWCRDFDNWALCDTACFRLFDRTPHAAAKIAEWVTRKDEFQKRAGFALLACVALHSKDAAQVRRFLPAIERGADDERNFVKKSVSWALRSVGRIASLRAEALALAQRLAAADEAAPRWVGKDAVRELSRPARAAKAKTAKQTSAT